MTATVKFTIRQDYETGNYSYERAPDDATGAYTFEISAEHFEHWERARQAWDTIEEEIGALLREREWKIDQERETEFLRNAAEKAQAEYAAHIARLESQ